MKFIRTLAFAMAAVCLMTMVGCDDDDDVIENEIENGGEENGNEDETETGNENNDEGEVVTPTGGTLAAPSPYFDADETTSTSLTLRWDAVSGASSYMVKWWKDGSLSGTVEESTQNTSYVLTGLEDQVLYYAQVKACSPDGEEYDSSYSSIVSCTAEDPEPGFYWPEDVPAITVSLVNASSSTLTFEWELYEDPVKSAENDYNVALYTDEACTDLWVSWIVSSELFTANGLTYIRFTFTGLDPGTNYWVKVNVFNNEDITGEPCGGTTTTFDHTVSTHTTAEVGDVLVAEDFHGLIHGGDLAFRAAAISTSSTSQRATHQISKGVNPTSYASPVDCSTEFNPFTGGSVSTAYTEGTGLADWCIGTGTNCSTRAGYAKIGGASAWGYLATPELSTIPEGKTATVKVDFSAMTYAQGSSDYGSSVLVAVIDNVVVGSKCQAEGWETGKSDEETVGDLAEYTNYELVSLDSAKGVNMKFVDFSITLSGVSNVSRIRFSSNTREAINNKTRFLLDNVVVTVQSID